jgi:ribosomal protein S18 acetylase RimI-like enzyme
MISIRTAKPGDINQLVALLKSLFAIEADFDFDRDKQTRGLQLLLKSDQACILVAEANDDKKLLGMCSIQTLISTAEGGAVGLLEDLVVDADFRNQGIGTKLLADDCMDAGGRATQEQLPRLFIGPHDRVLNACSYWRIKTTRLPWNFMPDITGNRLS